MLRRATSVFIRGIRAIRGSSFFRASGVFRGLEILCLMGAVVLLLGATTPQTRIATIDLEKVFDGYWRTQQAEVKLKDRSSEFEAQLKEFYTDYQKANDEFRRLDAAAGDSALSAAERGNKKKTAEAKWRDAQQLESQFNQLDRTARVTLDELRRRLRDDELRQIYPAVAVRAKAGGYTLVVDSSAHSADPKNSLVFPYAGGEWDLSQEVLARLNQDAPAEFLKPPAHK